MPRSAWAWALGAYRIEGIGVWSAPSPALFIPILCLFGGFMIQGATEEIMFRGWLMQLIASRHGLIAAIAINSIIFALLHGGNIKPSIELAFAMVNLVLFAVMISLYAIKEGSLWGVCAWHSAWKHPAGRGFRPGCQRRQDRRPEPGRRPGPRPGRALVG